MPYALRRVRGPDAHRARRAAAFRRRALLHARTGRRLWIFHTIPARNEPGYDTWQDGSADKNGNTGVWTQITVDEKNNIAFLPGIEKPKVDGFITAIRPDLKFANGKTPGVDVVHLHHGVWLNQSARDATMAGPERFFAAGEEKTSMILPKGYGYTYRATDQWTLNYMIHNLWPKPQKVWMTYDIDFIPATVAGLRIKQAVPIWMDVQNGSSYPVFNALAGTGTDGKFTYPTNVANPYPSGTPRNRYTVPVRGALIATAGHLHPGGLQTFPPGRFSRPGGGYQGGILVGGPDQLGGEGKAKAAVHDDPQGMTNPFYPFPNLLY